METWAIVTLVLGASAISALLTFLITKMQVRHSDKRLEKELQRQRKAESRQRRWVVRSEPLLRLRAEVAHMATMQNRVAVAQHSCLNTIGSIKEEEAKKELQKALDDWNNYLARKSLVHTLMLQFDTQLVGKVKKIHSDYIEHYHNIARHQKPKEMEEDMKHSEEIWPRIIETQSLINKRLEEL